MTATAKLRQHPLTGDPLALPAKPRMDIAALVQPKRAIRGTYDAARDSDEFKNYWANADALDADSANSRGVRQKLVSRSRYEVNNNGFVDGIVQTYANDLVGKGPTLRMQTGSSGFNALVEREWYFWQKATQLRRKLWCMAHAKVQDGEGLAVVRRNPGVKHAIKLDVVLYETEQCQSPDLWFAKQGRIDGIQFDEFGNPEFYEFLTTHPGSATSWVNTQSERVPARFVLHWYALRRPGQHRGVPEFASTLNVGASSRRFREAVVGSAEAVAAMGAVLLKTTLTPDEAELADPMSTMEYQKRMMTVLPDGYDAMQMKAEQPTSSYDSFLRSQINEQARPKNMPYNKAACDSSSYNYASGRLDHQTYYGGLDVEREDGNDLVLDPLFDLWFDSAVRAFGWLGGNPEAISQAAKAHAWDWPKHPVADIGTEATAVAAKLASGQTIPSRVAAENGEDDEDDCIQAAIDYGVTVEEYKRARFNAIFNAQNQQASMEAAAAQVEKAKEPAPAKKEKQANED